MNNLQLNTYTYNNKLHDVTMFTMRQIKSDLLMTVCQMTLEVDEICTAMMIIFKLFGMVNLYSFLLTGIKKNHIYSLQNQPEPFT